MSTQDNRLTILRVLVKAMSLVALCAFLMVLFGSLPERGSVDAKVEVSRYDISNMQPGDFRLLEWHSKPLYIVYRKPEWESALQAADASLYMDPGSKKSMQPEGFDTALRSNAPGWFVTLGLGTGMGCSLSFSPPSDAMNSEPVNADSAGREVSGYFTDACDQSRYDLSGRVYQNSSARRNTVVPVWRLEGGEIFVSE